MQQKQPVRTCRSRTGDQHELPLPRYASRGMTELLLSRFTFRTHSQKIYKLSDFKRSTSQQTSFTVISEANVPNQEDIAAHARDQVLTAS